jgi:hypothetical protein
MLKTYSSDDFRGKIDGIGVFEVKDRLDYSLRTTQERIDLLNEILSDPKIINFFEAVTEQKFNKTKNISAFKICLSTTNDLCEHTNINRLLEQMANYLIYAPDAPKLYEKTQYKFFDLFSFQNKLNRELSLDVHQNQRYGKVSKDMKDLNSVGDIVENDNRLNFLLLKKNFIKEKKITITKEDIEKDSTGILKAYNEAINSLLMLRRQIRSDPKNVKNILTKNQIYIIMNTKNINIEKINNGKLVNRSLMFIDRNIGYLRADIKTAKEQIFGIINLNCKNSIPYNSNLLNANYNDEETIKAIISLGDRNLMNDYGLLAYDIKNMADQLELDEKQKEIIKLLGLDYSYTKIGKQIGDYSKQDIYGFYKGIVKKIIKQNQNNWVEYIYINYVKGKYKTCKTCKETKLIKHFNKNNTKTSPDGYRPSCSQCRNKRRRKNN